MGDDIVERLRDGVHYRCSQDFVSPDPCPACTTREEAADEIERLREELADQDCACDRRAVIVRAWPWHVVVGMVPMGAAWMTFQQRYIRLSRARAACDRFTNEMTLTFNNDWDRPLAEILRAFHNEGRRG